jgi:hypothetical protein
MSTNPKKKYERFTTPVGTAVFPRLSEPDFKFKKDHGEYSVKLRLTKEEAEAILAKAEKVAEESYQEQVEAHKGKTDPKGKPIVIVKAEPSYALDKDDNDQPTGYYLIPFKMNGGYTDKKTGEKKKLTVPLFDAKGKPIKVEVWGGSQVKVAYQLTPYFAAADKKAGVSFRMEAVQVIDLVTRGSGNASRFGFAPEEGYEHQEVKEETPSEPFKDETPKTEVPSDAKARGNF